MTRPQTLADRREYLEAGLRELACGGCDAHVLVKKNSPHQTSVQWTGRAVRQCAEFAARVALGEATPLVDTCTTLRDTIEQAVRDGRLAVPDPPAEPIHMRPSAEPIDLRPSAEP